MSQSRARRFQPDAAHGAIEFFSIFCLINGFFRRPDHFHTEARQNPLGVELQCTVQRGLPTHRGQNRIRSLSLYNARNGLPLDGLDVCRIRHGGVSHNRGGIGIYENDPVTLFPECLAGLRA